LPVAGEGRQRGAGGSHFRSGRIRQVADEGEGQVEILCAHDPAMLCVRPQRLRESGAALPRPGVRPRGDEAAHGQAARPVPPARGARVDRGFIARIAVTQSATMSGPE
jgi:hypothetical protein